MPAVATITRNRKKASISVVASIWELVYSFGCQPFGTLADSQVTPADSQVYENDLEPSAVGLARAIGERSCV